MNTTIIIAIIAIIAVLICICSSISGGGAAFYMTQETEVPKPKPSPAPAGSPPPPTGSPPPPAASSSLTVREKLIKACPKNKAAGNQISEGNGATYDNYLFSGCTDANTCDGYIEDPISQALINKKEHCGAWELGSVGYEWDPSINKWKKRAASDRKYTKNVNMDSGGSDIECFKDGSSADFCKTKCDNDKTCKGYNYISVDPNRGWGWEGKSGCCYKTINGPLVSAPGIDFYALDSPSTPPSVVNATPVTASTPAPPPAAVTCTADGTWSNNSPVSPDTVITKSCSPGSIVRAKCKADGGWDSDNKCSPAFKPDNRTIKNRRRDNFCIDVPGSSKDNGTQMTMWDCHGGENQQFKMDDKQRLVNKNSGKCLDVSGGGHAGATVVQWDCHDGNNQKWEYDEKGRLHPVHAMDKCLDITDASNANGAKVLIWDCSDGNHQQWFTESADHGQAIKCTGYNPKGDGSVYRYLGDKKMSHYPSGEIASSWDSNWGNNTKQIDCTGFTLGADMTKLSSGDSISCIGNEGYIQRYVGDKTIRGYPSMEIADSWDSNWRSNKVIDCTGLKAGPVMEKAKETPWNNCAVWLETNPGKHDDWCRNDFGSHAIHVGQGQHGCAKGWGKGVCKN